MEKNYVPTTVDQSKLDLLLADAPELSDENKTKVILIINIEKVDRLLGSKPMSPKSFFNLYDTPIEYLKETQYNLQAMLNEKRYYENF